MKLLALFNQRVLSKWELHKYILGRKCIIYLLDPVHSLRRHAK